VASFPPLDAGDGQGVVGIRGRLGSDVDDHRRDHQVGCRVLVDGSAVLDEAVGRVHVRAAVLTQAEPAEEVPVVRERGDGVELDLRVARPQRHARGDRLGEIDDAGTPVVGRGRGVAGAGAHRAPREGETGEHGDQGTGVHGGPFGRRRRQVAKNATATDAGETERVRSPIQTAGVTYS